MTLLCLLACTTQTIVAQAHVHAPPVCAGTALVAADCVTDPGDAGHDRGGDAECPLCQAVLQGAAAPLAPGTLPFALLTQDAPRIELQPPLAHRAWISCHWRSRGPPSR
jgi:hypothetical protein